MEAGRAADPLVVERVQTGVRIETSLLTVPEALAESYEISMRDLLEGIVIHAHPLAGECWPGTTWRSGSAGPMVPSPPN